MIVCVSLIGCSVNPNNDSKAHGKDHEKQANSKEKGKDKGAKQDGKVISMKPIEVPDSNSDTKNYQMMYWSQGIKVEAYVAAPSESGAYPLSVFCHGGYSTPDDQKAHVTTIGEGNDLFHYDKTLIENYPSGQITIVPMYRGYGHSGGTISGLAKNAADTQNAIKAVTTYFNTHKNFPGINKGHLYLSGVSLGSVKSSMKNLHGLQ